MKEILTILRSHLFIIHFRAQTEHEDIYSRFNYRGVFRIVPNISYVYKIEHFVRVKDRKTQHLRCLTGF